ncbi:MAG: neutral zinc metallopeptidase [Saprospiraceae bacterium]
MRWQGRQGSDNVEDRRGGGGGSRAAGGIGIGVIIMAIIIQLLGGDGCAVIQQAAVQQPQTQQTQTQTSAEDDELAKFVSVVLKDTEQIWEKVFPEQLGRRYENPVLVLFTGQVRSACGNASAATGPFYCPGDNKLYIDLAFYQQLKNQFKAPGDFAMAYVVAHEVGHHVQNLLGFTQYVHQQKRQVSEKQYNQLSVRLELMADYLAGVWAHHDQKLNNILEEGDVEEAMRAAHAIGDDTIQKRSRGYVVPDSFTHGTSEQRMASFRAGLESGSVDEEILKGFFTQPLN